MLNHGTDEGGLRRSRLSGAIFRLAGIRRFRQLALRLSRRLEGGAMESATLRDILRKHHGVEVGAYSYGECLVPGSFPAGVSVGRYVSIARDVRVFLRNHPMERLSMHPYFYNANLKILDADSVVSGTLRIEHDAWVGERAIMTPGCSRIGLGAVVGAGAVVTSDVPDFAVVAGNPARLLRYRFDEPMRDLIRQSRWWEHDIQELQRMMPLLVRRLDREFWEHPALSTLFKAA